MNPENQLICPKSIPAWCRRFSKGFFQKSMMVAGLAAYLAACSPPNSLSPVNPAVPPAQRASLEIAFFNDFVVRNEQRGAIDPQGSISRGDRVRALAAKGLEIAALADQLFDFDLYGQPRDSLWLTRLTLGPWDRLRELALQGDAGAQCLFALASHDLKGRPVSVVTEDDATRLAKLFLDQAAERKHPLCAAVWAMERFPGDPVRHARANLEGAKAGCAVCQMRLYSFYSTGHGVPIDLAKSYCWLQEAVRSSDTPSYASSLDMAFVSQRSRRMDGKPDLPLHFYRQGTACTEPANP